MNKIKNKPKLFHTIIHSDKNRNKTKINKIRTIYKDIQWNKTKNNNQELWWFFGLVSQKPNTVLTIYDNALSMINNGILRQRSDLRGVVQKIARHINVIPLRKNAWRFISSLYLQYHNYTVRYGTTVVVINTNTFLMSCIIKNLCRF